MVLGVLTGWLDRREREAIAYLTKENRLLRRQLGGRRLRLTDDDRRRLAARAHRVGRAALQQITTIATPEWRRRMKHRGRNRWVDTKFDTHVPVFDTLVARAAIFHPRNAKFA